MKKIILAICLTMVTFSVFAQDTTLSRREAKELKKQEKRNRENAIIKQEEEGVLVYNKQNAFGVQVRTNGYGFFYELGRMKTPRRTNLYLLELTEIKDPKEEKASKADGFFNNSFIYGKINNFYQAKLGFGQQYILGQKGNKNGIAVMAIYQGGLSLGLLRPYYLQVTSGGTRKDIKYDSPDSSLFRSGQIEGSSGLSKGWNEMKIKPGAFLKTALRFDFGRYNEMIQAIQIGASIEAYTQKIPILLDAQQKQLFFQGHIAFVFGRRK